MEKKMKSVAVVLTETTEAVELSLSIIKNGNLISVDDANDEDFDQYIGLLMIADKIRTITLEEIEK